MEFSEQYLNYEEYRSLGGTLDRAPFNLLEFEARKRIDSLTQLRLKNLEYKDIPQEVKICLYNVMNLVTKYINDDNRYKESERVGNYSVTYKSDIKTVVENKAVEINDIIINDLYGVIVNNEHLIYAGV